ncbi:MAG: hypothetical protein ACI915_004133, partial [Gammaproteobacteria bacterium]
NLMTLVDLVGFGCFQRSFLLNRLTVIPKNALNITQTELSS